MQCLHLRRNNIKYATELVGTQNRQVACVHGTQDQKQSTFNKFKPAQEQRELKPLNIGLLYFAQLQNHKETAINSIQLWFPRSVVHSNI